MNNSHVCSYKSKIYKFYFIKFGSHCHITETYKVDRERHNTDSTKKYSTTTTTTTCNKWHIICTYVFTLYAYV